MIAVDVEKAQKTSERLRGAGSSVPRDDAAQRPRHSRVTAGFDTTLDVVAGASQEAISQSASSISELGDELWGAVSDLVRADQKAEDAVTHILDEVQ